MIIKNLEITDNLEEYLNLISQLKPTNLSVDSLKLILNNFSNNHEIFIIKKNSIIGSITFLIEQKIIHNGKNVLHIEDVIVDKNSRGLNIGKTLLNLSIDYAKKNNCYKIILDCKSELKIFYEKCNFTETNIQMSYYLE